MNKELLTEIEYLEWLIEHIGKGYTKEFYENSAKHRLKQLQEKDDIQEK